MMSPGEMRELLEDIRQPVRQEIDINLRIQLLEKQLTHRTDLTRRERRALQSRKNTSIFRVRKQQSEMNRNLHRKLIPKTDLGVSLFTFFLFRHLNELVFRSPARNFPSHSRRKKNKKTPKKKNWKL
jgi:hypothetical protein